MRAIACGNHGIRSGTVGATFLSEVLDPPHIGNTVAPGEDVAKRRCGLLTIPAVICVLLSKDRCNVHEIVKRFASIGWVE